MRAAFLILLKRISFQKCEVLHFDFIDDIITQLSKNVSDKNSNYFRNAHYFFAN
jgi:hypothetical protein